MRTFKKSYSNVINPLDPPEKQRTFWCAPPMHANLAISCARSSFASYVLSLTIAALGDCSNRSFTRHFNQVSPVADISLCARDRTGMTPGIFSMVMRPVFSPKVPISRALCPWGRGSQTASTCQHQEQLYGMDVWLSLRQDRIAS